MGYGSRLRPTTMGHTQAKIVGIYLNLVQKPDEMLRASRSRVCHVLIPHGDCGLRVVCIRLTMCQNRDGISKSTLAHNHGGLRALCMAYTSQNRGDIRVLSKSPMRGVEFITSQSQIDWINWADYEPDRGE